MPPILKKPILQKLILPLLLLLLLGGLALALMQKNAAPAASFMTTAGETLELKQLRGKMVVVNFWATSCPGCIEEMPKLVATYQRYHSKGLEIVAVAMSYDPPSHVVNYAKQHALPFPVALDAKADVAAAFGNVQVTPTSFVIDKQGNIVRHIVGEIDFAALETLLAQAL